MALQLFSGFHIELTKVAIIGDMQLVQTLQVLSENTKHIF